MSDNPNKTKGRYAKNREKINKYKREHRAKNRERENKKNREYYAKNCETIRKQAKGRYAKNPEKIKEQSRGYRTKNPEKIKKQRKEHYDKNSKELNKKHREYYAKNSEKLTKQKREYNAKNSEKINKKARAHRAKNHEKRIKLREQVFSHYANPVRCVCCGIDDIDFLTIDHIIPKREMQNDPKMMSIDYKFTRSGEQLVIWLKNNNYPDGFQILCVNCNFAKGKLGVCPHKSKV